MDYLLFLAVIVVPYVLISLLPILLMLEVIHLVGRYLNQRIAIGIAITCIGLLAWYGVELIRGCDAEPTWVAAPQSEEGVRPEFACGAPVGFYVNIYVYIACPISMMLFGYAAYRSWRTLRRKTEETA